MSREPMTSDSAFNAKQQQLISPPPEDTIHRTKRKQEPNPPNTTPNPKPRKQQKQNLSPVNKLVLSPHSSNPHADYIPPLSLSRPTPRRSVLAARSSRRSATPIPPYEPPTDIFTPPKEVFVTPVTTTVRISKSSKRKSAKKTRSTPAPAQTPTIKLEMPDVDLNAPMPPPSPGDDPLLLSSSIEPASTPTKPRSRSRSSLVVAYSEPDVLRVDKATDAIPTRRTTSPTPVLFPRLRLPDLPPSSPPPPNEPSDQPSPIIDDSADLDTTPVHMPFFDLDNNAHLNHDDGWSDSDDDNDHLPVMGSRREEGEGEYTGKWKELLIRTKADPPSSATKCRIDEWGNPKSPFPFERKSVSLERALDPVPEVQADDVQLGSDDERDEEEVRRMSVEPEQLNDQEQQTEEVDSIDEGQDRGLPGEEPQHARDEVLIQSEPADRVQIQVTDDADDTDEPTSSDTDEAGIVKITSADPIAAARATAILKQHNYDCFTKLELKRRRSDTLRTLLREAETQVSATAGGPGLSVSPSPFAFRSNSATPLFATPPPPRARSVTPRLPMTPGEMCYDPLTGERLWTKEEWKRLDACFTDERLDIGQRLSLGLVDQDGLANVDLVRVEDVVERFVDWMGGWETINNCGPLWSRENLLQRTRALHNKQRSGDVAPPTTPFSPDIQSPLLNRRPPVPFLDIPDFTPIRRHPPPPRHQWTSVIAPAAAEKHVAPFQSSSSRSVPPTLLAPRYSHLLDEAIAISKETAEAPLRDQDDSPDLDAFAEQDSPMETLLDTEQPSQQSNTIGNRVKGLLFSYLPTLKKDAPPNHRRISSRPGLPLPPKDVLEKPRGPVITPAREPLPKSIHPKELVHLQQAPPLPPIASKIPRVIPPKQLVELHPPPPKPAAAETLSSLQPRPRRSSGASSVKDLIQGFEDMDNQSRGGGVSEVRRMRSIGEWRKGAVGANGTKGERDKPAWRP